MTAWSVVDARRSIRSDAPTSGQDLRSALEAYEAAGALLTVDERVSWEFEAAAVLWRLSEGPAVVFRNVDGYQVPIVGNVLNDRRKLATALEIPVDELQPRLVDALHAPVPVNRLAEGPCQELLITDVGDLLELLPVPRISEHDGGRYITAGIIIARDPDTGRRNMAIARIRVETGSRLGCFLAPTHTYQFLQRCRELGRPLEVAVVIGTHPALMAASQLLIPGDEFETAGAILGRGLDVVSCRTVDLEVPAGAEIVLEGTIDPTILEVEGPFGEFAGTYSSQRPNPVIDLRVITTRERPMFQMIVGGSHPEHLITGAVAREATLLDAVRAAVPGVKAVRMTEGGSYRFHAVISLVKRVEGEGKLAILAALANQDLLKHVVVVDADVDIEDPVQVEWAIATRVRPHEDLTLIEGVKSNPVDHMSVDGTITKMGIDATLRLDAPSDGYPRPAVPAAVEKAVAARWERIITGGQGT